MKRTKQHKKPDLIFCGDFHLRDIIPTCRTDDFLPAQTKKLNFISELQLRYNCAVVHTGDLWDNWKPSPFMITYAIKYLPKNFWSILGNHDLPQHSLELIYKSGINTLAEAGWLKIIDGCHWQETPEHLSLIFNTKKILVWHIMTYKGKQPFPGCTDPAATKLLRKYPQYDLIVTGHNHKSFVEKYEGRLLVNPGSLTRQKADQIDHRPCVYLWYAETNTVKPVYLPIEQDVITREHITRQEQRDERIDAFISRLDDDWKAAVSFEENLERFAKANRIRTSVMDIVTNAIES